MRAHTTEVAASRGSARHGPSRGRANQATNSGNGLPGAAGDVDGVEAPAAPGGNSRLEIDYRPITGLIPYARNARTHSDAQIAEIAASIRAFGFTNPVLVDGDNGIIAGHGRVLAARKLGMATVPVIELAGMSEAEKRAYILADNKLALKAGWDEELLAAEIGDLSDLGFDLALTGFELGEIDALLADDTPAFPARRRRCPRSR